jgi:tetratricopeptide (TPR) repeat protein
MKKIFLLIIVVLNFQVSFSQLPKVDSLKNLLNTESIDSNIVKLRWQLAIELYNSNPDSALVVVQEGLYLAQKIKYVEGESRSLGVIANTFSNLGNFPKALFYNIAKLKIEEKRNVPRNLAAATMNIGIIYALTEEYDKALMYYNKSDSIIEAKNVIALKKNIAVNKGDLYDRIKKNDSAQKYFSKALNIAKVDNDVYFMGAATLGLAHSTFKLGNEGQAITLYKDAEQFLKLDNNNDLLCENYTGLAKVFLQKTQKDSALFFARYALALAKKSDFPKRQLEATELIFQIYQKDKNIDSAYAYLLQTNALKEQLNNKDIIRQAQVLTINETLRQNEIIVEKKKEKVVRKKQLQLLLIGLFIPVFFLLTLLVSRKKVSEKTIRVMAILSLLFFFEYITLLMHPIVGRITNHKPFFEILIYVVFAAFLIPIHHKLEHWFIEKTTRHKLQPKTTNEEEISPLSN